MLSTLLLECVHDVDDLWCLSTLGSDGYFRCTLLHLRLHKLVHGLGILVRHLLRLELARLLLYQIDGEPHRIGVGLGLDLVEIGFGLP